MFSEGEGRSVGVLITCHIRTKNSPATMMVRGPSRELSLKHSTMVPSTMEASDSEVRVAVKGPLVLVRVPRNTGLPCVVSVLLVVKVMLNTAPCGGVMSHRMTLPGRVQVKVIVSSGQATVGVDISVAAQNLCVSVNTCTDL